MQAQQPQEQVRLWGTLFPRKALCCLEHPARSNPGKCHCRNISILLALL